MKHNIKKHLFDILTSIESINQYLGEDRNFDAYERNKLLRRAVEREIEIIGEAMGRILSQVPDIKIKHARKIVDTRNWVIHTYDNVDNIIIWSIVTKDLPLLKKEVKDLIEK